MQKNFIETTDLDQLVNVYGQASGSIVDGPGIRYAIFVQGCKHKCIGCHNKDSWEYGAGKDISVAKLLENIYSAKSCLGVTLSGGEPFDQVKALSSLSCELKNKSYNIWCYTGYLYEDLLKNQESKNLLNHVDVLVDGPFIKSKKNMECLYRGSTNQRLIDVPKSLQADKIVLWQDSFQVPQKPMSW